MINDAAFRTLATIRPDTRIFTLRIDAGKIVWTLCVRLTSGNAESILADKSTAAVIPTVTQRLADTAHTNFIEQTFVSGGGALGGADSVDTSEPLGTSAVALTGLYRVCAGLCRVAGEAGGAAAQRLVVGHAAESVGATRGAGGPAWICTLVVDAGLVAGAV